MLVYNLLKSLVLALNTVFAYMPDGSHLPNFFGVDTDYYFSLGVSYLHLLAVIFPPLTVIAEGAVVYLSWLLIKLGLRVFLGDRVPVHH